MSLLIRMQFEPDVWVDVLGPAAFDVLDMDGITWRRGIQGNGPKDNTATAGTLAFTLDNSHLNSQELQGAYSPHSENCRAGFGIGTPVQVLYDLNGTEVPLWTGKLASIDPAPGVTGQYTRCRAVSLLGDLLEEKVRAIAPQLNQTEVQLLAAVIAALPETAQPPAATYDDALDEYPFALDDLESGTLALSIIHNIVTSAQGYWFEAGDGSPRYVNRLSRALAVSQFAFTDEHLNPETGLSRPASLATVFNRVRMQTHAKKVSAVDTDVLFSHRGRLAIPAGETVELWFGYQDQAAPEFKIGGEDFQNPLEAGTDRSFNDAEDGSGADLTASVSVTASFFSSTCKLVITNNAGVTAYKQILQGRGRSIRDLSPVWVEAFTAMPYGVRTAEIDLRYQDDPIVARDQAAFLEASYRDLARQIDAIEFFANQSEEVLEQAVRLEIGDVVTVSESVTGTVLVSGYIQWKEWTVGKGGLITCRFGLAPRIVTDEIQIDFIEIGDVLTADVHAPETRIGFALVGFSEIG